MCAAVPRTTGRSTYPHWPATAWPDSLWRTTARDWSFPALADDEDVDVLIIGAGYTGLWTAKFLTDIDPRLSVAVVDAMQPGYGASGRNGGWCSALMPMSLAGIASRAGRTGAIDLQHALIAAVNDIGDFITEHRLDCGWHHGGTLSIATNKAQLVRGQSMVQEYRSFGFSTDFVDMVDPLDAERRVRTGRAIGGWFSPHCASLNPVGLVDGLVELLVRRGVRIHGSTHVTSIDGRVIRARTPSGFVTLTPRWNVLATEGFTSAVPGHRRRLAPIHSYMVATEPLPAGFWRSMGWTDHETFADGRHVVIYAQRTQDDRIAFGGRGAPYSFASRLGPRYDTNGRIHDRIVATLRTMFPDTAEARITHRWGGALGVPRDWHTSVVVDETCGRAMVGGYVGDGVAFSHVAARAAAHAILSADDSSTRLPIVGHVSPRWEPEPLRWIGINAMLRLGGIVDRLEATDSRFARVGERMLDRVVG